MGRRSIPKSISKANHQKFNVQRSKRKRENSLFKTSPDADLSKSVPSALKGNIQKGGRFRSGGF